MATVVLLGASGLVGCECLTQLLAEPSVTLVRCLVRRDFDAPPSPKLEIRITDLEHLDARPAQLRADTVICALGTTIKVAGSQERFRVVDHDIPVAAARLARAEGATQYLLVSSIGAAERSGNFYLRVKGETERDIRAVGYPSFGIVRPSLLLGARREFRLGERLGQLLAWVPMGAYTPIHARDVAAALARLVKERPAGERIVENTELRAWARAATPRSRR
jgi:uncharacterized protein YbjT (DUF2867 family)